MIGHQGVALVTHSVLFAVDLAQSTLLLAAILTHGLATPFTVVLENHADTAELLTAQHAHSRVKLLDRLNVIYLGQIVFFFRVLVF